MLIANNRNKLYNTEFGGDAYRLLEASLLSPRAYVTEAIPSVYVAEYKVTRGEGGSVASLVRTGTREIFLNYSFGPSFKKVEQS